MFSPWVPAAGAVTTKYGIAGLKAAMELEGFEAGAPRRPLLPFVEKLNERLPRKWDRKLNRFVPDDDWLLWDFHTRKIRGKHVESIRQ